MFFLKNNIFFFLRCWTSGWGKNSFGEYGRYQNILKEVDVPVINKYQCEAQLRRTRLGPSYNLPPGMLCAGGEEGKDACKGKKLKTFFKKVMFFLSYN